MIVYVVELLDDWNKNVPIWKYRRNFESPRVSSPGFGNDSKVMLTQRHSSQIGLGCAINLLTGFLMDFETMSKRCIECEHAKSGLGENSVEFHVWYEGHISSCGINNIGSSCAMGQEATLKL
ncbi:uncharacterized protein TNCV_2008911 [Trichonephila clavipes]|nr:uncharacterized protein TNCV_2008911 [Trichonephila clavipes]